MGALLLRTIQNVNLDLLTVSSVDIVEASEDRVANNLRDCHFDFPSGQSALVSSRTLDEFLTLRSHREVSFRRGEHVLAANDDHGSTGVRLDVGRLGTLLVKVETSYNCGNLRFKRLCHLIIRIRQKSR